MTMTTMIRIRAVAVAVAVAAVTIPGIMVLVVGIISNTMLDTMAIHLMDCLMMLLLSLLKLWNPCRNAYSNKQ